jgi:hypothetical protein
MRIREMLDRFGMAQQPFFQFRLASGQELGDLWRQFVKMDLTLRIDPACEPGLADGRKHRHDRAEKDRNQSGKIGSDVPL